MFKEDDKIGQYKLVRRLGVGGFGEVWLAKKRSLFITKQVAIKLPLEHQIDLDAIGKEAALWEQASGHPNVLPIIDADIYDGQVAIVSEYVDGGSLHDKLKKERKLPLKNCVQMTSGILKGLEYLHSKGIIHRDLKPQNILLQGDTPRIADFGISRANTSSTQDAAGTPAYMSPEAFDGQRNIQTDIWAVGIIIYRMLFGDLPFPQKDMPSLIKAIIFDEIDKFPSKIPVTLEVILHKALHKDPNKRYETVGEMLEEIQSPVFDYLMLMQRQESKRETEKSSQLKVDPDQQPRVLHYTFAHRFLPEIVARQPKLFVESLLKPKSNMINVRWVMNARNYSDKEFIPADGLCCFPIHFSENQYGVLIQLPQPTRMAEAYYVAVILKEDSSLVSYRYITLELTANSDGVAKTIIGEWNGGHKNYGTGPDPDPELFIEALRKLLVV